MSKKYIDKDVLTSARERISYVFDSFDKVYASFSGGKDSTVMVHLMADEARKRDVKFGLLFIDLEAQYKLTIDLIQRVYDDYKDLIDPYWVCLPLSLRNAVSVYEPKWTCWEPSKKSDWVRRPPKIAITDQSYFPFFHEGMEFEEFMVDFGIWYSKKDWEGDGVGALTCAMVGIRSDESLNRYRSIAGNKQRFQDKHWTTWVDESLYNGYPIYDWRTEDVWRFHAKSDKPYNKLYDRMHQAGLSIHQARICQPYGDDQRKGLWLYQIIEPETWAKVVARVNGANSGALYSQESGNINGTIKINRPPHLSWQEFAGLLLESMPESTADHYRDKIAVFLNWWQQRGYPNGIPDTAKAQDERSKKAPSWRRICKTLLRNDYWCKELSFNQTQSESYKRYKEIMKKRRQEWDLPEIVK